MFSFFFNDTATTEIYTLSLHDALPIYQGGQGHGVAAGGGAARALGRARGERARVPAGRACAGGLRTPDGVAVRRGRSEEHTSELQSRQYLVCRLLLEKKKK